MKISKRTRFASAAATTVVLALAGLSVTAPSYAASPLAPGVTVTTDTGHTVVSSNGITISTLNGATIASFHGEVVASLSAAQTRDVNALAVGISTPKQNFDATAAAEAGATKQSIADAATVLAAGGWTITGDANTPTASPMAISAAASSCHGSNGYHGYYFPWGAQYGFNSCNTAKLIADVGLGSAGGGVILAGLALGGVVTGGVSTVIAAVLALGVAGLVACEANSSKSAIWLNVGGAVGVLGMSCWGQ